MAEPGPRGFVDGPNLYAYVRCNPWSEFDPDGLQGGRIYTPTALASMKAERENFANSAIGKIYNGAAQTGAGFIPWVGDAMDAVDVVNPSSTGFERGLAATSLTVNAYSAGLLPNAGPIVKGVKGIGEGVVQGVQELFKKGSKVDDVAKTAEQRAAEIHAALKPGTQSRTTTAVTETAEGTRVVSSSERRLRPAQRKALQPGEVEGVGPGHAEVTGVNAAEGMGLTPTGTAASRPICPSCSDTLQKRGVQPLSPVKKRN